MGGKPSRSLPDLRTARPPDPLPLLFPPHALGLGFPSEGPRQLTPGALGPRGRVSASVPRRAELAHTSPRPPGSRPPSTRRAPTHLRAAYPHSPWLDALLPWVPGALPP